MTVKDYEERIMKAKGIERLSDIARMVESDTRLSDDDRAKLAAIMERRRGYFAVLAATP